MAIVKTALVTILLLLGLALATLFGWYQIDGQPTAPADTFLSGSDYRINVEPGGGYLFSPRSANGKGILLMHGALIKPKSYSQTAAFFAQRGYTVYLPSGGWTRLSIFAIDRAAARMATLPVKDWYLIGHSMGGYAALSLITQHAIKPKAIALWATAMPDDFSRLRLPSLLLRGSRDGLLDDRRFESTRQNFPQATKVMLIDGGNHKNFARYSHQFFDNPASLPAGEQIERANTMTLLFFQQHP